MKLQAGLMTTTGKTLLKKSKPNLINKIKEIESKYSDKSQKITDARNNMAYLESTKRKKKDLHAKVVERLNAQRQEERVQK